MNKKRIYILLLIIFFIALTCVTSIVVAKYIKTQNGAIGITAENFYFTVDLLGDTVSNDTLSKSYTLAGGDDKEILFNVQNYFDDFRINATDITYQVKMEVTSTSANYDKSKITLSKEVNTNYVLSKSDKKTDEWKLNVPTGYGNDTKVLVTIVSSKPFAKEMKLEFIFKTFDSEYSYEVIDASNSPIARLIIKTNIDIQVNALTIDFSQINATDNILQIDTTDEYIVDIDENGIPQLNTNSLKEGQTYYTSVVNTKQINAGEAIEIIFFKTDLTKDYSMSLVSSNSEEGKFSVILK